MGKICPKHVELILEINKTVIVASRWFLYYLTYIDDVRSNKNQVNYFCSKKLVYRSAVIALLFLWRCVAVRVPASQVARMVMHSWCSCLLGQSVPYPVTEEVEKWLITWCKCLWYYSSGGLKRHAAAVDYGPGKLLCLSQRVLRSRAHKFPVWPTFQGDRNRTSTSTSASSKLEHVTTWYWYINLTIDGAIYPLQHFPFGAAFVCQTGNFWIFPRKLCLM